MKELLLNLWNKIRPILAEIGLFLSSWIFIRNLLALVVVAGLFVVLTFGWLKCYTNHGESLQVHKYTGMTLNEAVKLANSRSFSIVVNDSIFKVGEEPHTVIEQTPKPFSRVKKNRTIYLVVTKKQPDLLLLPDLKGGNDDFELYKKKVERMEFETEVRREVYDENYAPNTILNVYYDGEEITEKLNKGFRAVPGTTIEFVITKGYSDLVEIPDLVCKKFDAAKFVLNSYNLTVGDIFEEADVYDPENAFVYKQVPAFSPGGTMPRGTNVSLYLTQERPIGCPEERTDLN
jgi:beta-lactam-binding protein with PASTA domain